ncbi:MAG: YARHG domain-containing protein [Oscillospiraceae bacterium]|nr:YARHG domain-containing protein [Oscillospiraceae bacterium]
MICKACGATIPDNAYFCGGCGALVNQSGSETSAQPMYDNQNMYNYSNAGGAGTTCSYCGAAVLPGSVSCPSCGNRLDIGQMPPVQPMQQGMNMPPVRPMQQGGQIPPAYMPQNKNNTGLIVAVAVIGALLLIVFAVIIVLILNQGKGTPEPEQVVVAQTQAPQAANNANTNTANNNVNVPVNNPPVNNPPVNVPPVNNPPVNIYQSDGYLFPSDSAYITESDLAGLSQSTVRLILNEIYARRGYSFTSSEYRNYFSQKSWYRPRTGSQADVERTFNSIETANKNFIINYELRRGWR